MCKIDKNKVEKLATNYAKLCLMVVKKETGMVKECVEGELISLSKDLSNKIEWFMEIVNRSEQKLVKQR